MVIWWAIIVVLFQPRLSSLNGTVIYLRPSAINLIIGIAIPEEIGIYKYHPTEVRHGLSYSSVLILAIRMVFEVLRKELYPNTKMKLVFLCSFVFQHYNAIIVATHIPSQRRTDCFLAIIIRGSQLFCQVGYVF